MPGIAAIIRTLNATIKRKGPLRCHCADTCSRGLPDGRLFFATETCFALPAIPTSIRAVTKAVRYRRFCRRSSGCYFDSLRARADIERELKICRALANRDLL